MPTKATEPKKMNGDPEPGNRLKLIATPPKKPPNDSVKNNCSGSCAMSAIQPIKTGFSEKRLANPYRSANPVCSARRSLGCPRTTGSGIAAAR
jgi:hypothetical protein